jgi:hypothetical protein
MASSCVNVRRCGTDATGWMNGAHPTVADGKVTRKVCYHWGSCIRMSSDNVCYHWQGDCYKYSNVEVVNCGQYYVYKLSPPPKCPYRYCGSDNWFWLFHVHIMMHLHYPLADWH